MKRNFIKNILTMSLAASFLGAGLFVKHNQRISEADAAAHQDNFAAYTYAGSYYDGIEGSTGLNGTLRKALTSLCYPDGFYTYGSSGSDHLSTQLQYADEDPTNSSNMIYLYTRESVKKNAASSWNREHVWPQNLSNGCWGTSTAGTDILHIRPTYDSTNNKRSNYKYGNASNASNLTYNGIVYGKLGTYFEPIDSVKGDVARIIMYVWTTYVEHYGNLPEITNTFQSYDVMMQWHLSDAPDAMEGHRNDYSETSKQKNRNPFVDHPEYAWKIFGDKCSSNVLEDAKSVYPDDGTVAKYLSIDKSTVTIEEEDTAIIKARASDKNVNVSWSVKDSTIVSLSSYSSKPGDNITITGLKRGSTTVTAKTTIDDEEFTKTCTVNVTEKSSTIIDETKGLSIDNPLTPKEAVELMEKAGEGIIVGTNKEYYVKGILEEGTKYDTKYLNWSGSMGYGFTLESASNNSGVTVNNQDGGLDGKEVIAKGYLEKYNGKNKMGYLPPSVSPTGAKFNPSIVYIENGEIPPTPTPTPTPSLTITLSNTSLDIEVGQALSISATTSDGSDINWSMSNTNIGLMETTSKSGEEITVIGAKAGTSIITAKSGNVEAQCIVTITQPVVTIELSQTQVTSYVGETFKLKATTSNKTQVAWSKDNDFINLSASVSGSGMEITVTCLEVGEAKITAKSTSGEEAYCYITIVEKMEPTPTPTPTPEPTPTPTPTPEPEPQPSKKGCGGNVVSSSIIVSSLALSSLGFVLLRIILKKHK